MKIACSKCRRRIPRSLIITSNQSSLDGKGDVKPTSHVRKIEVAIVSIYAKDDYCYSIAPQCSLDVTSDSPSLLMISLIAAIRKPCGEECIEYFTHSAHYSVFFSFWRWMSPEAFRNNCTHQFISFFIFSTLSCINQTLKQTYKQIDRT